MRLRNTEMRTFVRFAQVMLISLALCPTLAFGQIDSLDQFAEFSQTYYSNPRPDLVPAATLAKTPEQIRAETTAVVKEQRQRGVW